MLVLQVNEHLDPAVFHQIHSIVLCHLPDHFAGFTSAKSVHGKYKRLFLYAQIGHRIDLTRHTRRRSIFVSIVLRVDNRHADRIDHVAAFILDFDLPPFVADDVDLRDHQVDSPAEAGEPDPGIFQVGHRRSSDLQRILERDTV